VAGVREEGERSGPPAADAFDQRICDGKERRRAERRAGAGRVRMGVRVMMSVPVIVRVLSHAHTLMRAGGLRGLWRGGCPRGLPTPASYRRSLGGLAIPRALTL
jgi:hypothetical protein